MQPSLDEIRSRRINPMVDYAFKILLGSEQNRDVTVFFLNSVLRRTGENRLVDVTLINPYNDKDAHDDKLTVVDVKAKDASGRIYQIEVQLVVHPYLPQRMLYVWSQLYGKQLAEGQSFDELRPVTSIWLLRGTLFKGVEAYAHEAHFQDRETRVVLDPDSAIHILEVGKWSQQGQVQDKRDEWLKFMWEASNMDLEALSEHLSPEFARAVEALRPIREREEDYWRYSARLEALRVQLTMENALAKSQVEQALTLEKLQKAMVVMAEQEQALAEKERILEAERQEKARANQALEAERQEKARANEALAERERSLAEREQALEAERQEKARANQALEAERQEKARANAALEAQRQEIATLQAMLKAVGKR